MEYILFYFKFSNFLSNFFCTFSYNLESSLDLNHMAENEYSNVKFLFLNLTNTLIF